MCDQCACCVSIKNVTKFASPFQPFISAQPTTQSQSWIQHERQTKVKENCRNYSICLMGFFFVALRMLLIGVCLVSCSPFSFRNQSQRMLPNGNGMKKKIKLNTIKICSRFIFCTQRPKTTHLNTAKTGWCGFWMLWLYLAMSLISFR